MSNESYLAEVNDVTDQVRAVMRGRPAEVQGGVLANLMAVWLAGFRIAGVKEGEGNDESLSAEETKAILLAIRKKILGEHIKAVLELVPEYEKEESIHG